MKWSVGLILILINLVFFTTTNAQADCRSILKKAVAAYDAGKGNLDVALQYLQDAEVCDYLNSLQKERQALQRNIFAAIKKQKEEADAARTKAQEETIRADGERANALAAQKTAEERYREAQASKLAFLADAEREKGNMDDAFALAYEAYKLTKEAPIPAVKQAFGNAVNRKFGIPIQIKNAISKIGFFPDGKRFFLVSRDSKIQIYDVAGKLIHTGDQHTDLILDAIASSSGQYLLTVSKDKTAKLWDNDGRLLHNLLGHEQEVNTGCFSADESKILTASRDGMVKIWDTSTGQVWSSSKVHNSAILQAETKQDLFLTRSAKKVVVQDWTGMQIATITHNDAIIYSATFSADGAYILTASADHTAKLWKNDGTLIRTLQAHNDVVTNAVFAHTGNQILTSSTDGTLKWWDWQGNQLKTYSENKAPIRSCLFATNDSFLAAIGNDNKIVLWNQSGKPLDFDQHRGKITTVAFSQDSYHILSAAGGNDHTAKLWDVHGDVIVTNSFSGTPLASFSSDGSLILVAAEDGNAQIYPLPQIIYEQIQSGQLPAPKVSDLILDKYGLRSNLK